MNGGAYLFVTLFEAALIIGMRIDPCCPHCLLSDSISLFLNAALKKEIDPRTPLTHIPYSKAPPAHKVLDGEIIETKAMPDMSWTLTLKEVAEFAILKGYPEHLFTDLLSDTKTALVSQSSQDEQRANKDDAALHVEKKQSHQACQQLDERERQTLYAIIYALCNMQSMSPVDKGLAAKISKTTETLGVVKSEGCQRKVEMSSILQNRNVRFTLFGLRQSH